MKRFKFEIKLLFFERYSGPDIGIRGRIFGHRWAMLIPIPSWICQKITSIDISGKDISGKDNQCQKIK